MKKCLLILAVIFFSIYMFGCGRKDPGMEELTEPISMETLSLTTDVQAGPKAKTAMPETQTGQVISESVPPAKLESLPPGPPYKPTASQIQTALKNAGYYTAEIDAKIGPLSKKAIEEFQKANGLEVDGKVGPKTWAVLSAYLNPPAEAKEKR